MSNLGCRRRRPLSAFESRRWCNQRADNAMRSQKSCREPGYFHFFNELPQTIRVCVAAAFRNSHCLLKQHESFAPQRAEDIAVAYEVADVVGMLDVPRYVVRHGSDGTKKNETNSACCTGEVTP